MSDTDLVKALSEEVRCNVCLELFDDPRVLDCLHTFCLGCISQIVKRSQGRSVVDCPLCRNVTFLGTNQVNGLKKNHYLANIAEKIKESIKKDIFILDSSTTQPVNITQTQTSSLPSYNPAYTSNFNTPPSNSHQPQPSAPPLHQEEAGPSTPPPQVNQPPPPPPSQSQSSQPYLNSVTSFFSNLLYGSRNEPPQPPIRAMNEEFSYIPFSVAPSQVPTFFNQWASSLWLLPSDFSFQLPADSVSAMYVPYYAFSVTVNTRCQAKVSRTDADPRDPARATTDHWLDVDSDYLHRHPNLLVCAAVQDQQAAYMGLVEQLDWQLDDSAVRSQPGPPLDIPIVNYQGHDVIWHEVAEKVIRTKEREKCEFDLKSQPLIANVKEVTLEINFLNVTHNGVTGGAQGNRPYGLGKIADISKKGFEYVSSFIFNKS